MIKLRFNKDLVAPAAAVLGIAVLAYYFIPGVHEVLFAIGWLALVLLGLAATGLVVFGIFRLLTPERHMTALNSNPFAASNSLAADKPEQK